MEIECADKLGPLINTDKRVKILVGGRGSTKSTFVADYVLSSMANGGLWCCGREFQNSIEESVHRLMLDEVDRLGLAGFRSDSTHIYHDSGGRNFYRGLGRNISSIKSMLSGVDGLWIEEGDTLSANTLKVLTASLRLSAKDSQRVIEGEDLRMPEIWVTMNRGSSNDPIAVKWLKRAEKSLASSGFYEDDHLLIVEINYTDIPQAWFLASGLESERLDDLANLSEAEYGHKWLGEYADSVDRAIIKPHWFDACIDAHEKLGIKPRGAKIIAHDPSDEGSDDKGLAYRHGIVVFHADEKETGDIADGGDWALDYCEEINPDVLTWDGDGMGVGLRRQFVSALEDTRTELVMFKGSYSPEDPDKTYDGDSKKENKQNQDVFKNRRAQYYMRLRDRVFKTYQMVNRLAYHDPDDLISFSSGIEKIGLLRSELCRIPTKPNASRLIQIASKDEMRAMGIPSPNMADSVMMLWLTPPAKQETQVRKPQVKTGSRSASRFERRVRR